jgi:P-type Cu+ transporter
MATIELDVDGMTCAACAARIERKLNRMDGVEATVNYATERAAVQLLGESADVDTVIEQIEQLGYHAAVHQTAMTTADDSSTDPLRLRIVIGATLALPVVAISMVPSWQFDGWQWFVAALSVPVTTWGAWPFHRAAFMNARHRTSTMDTLISIGVTAAMVWSVGALVFGDAGHIGMTHEFSLRPMRGMASQQVYFEAAVTVVVFVLAGRHIEQRARRRAGDALQRLAELGQSDVGVIRDGVESRRPVAELVVGDRFVVRPGERFATDGLVEDGSSSVDRSLVTGESLPVAVAPGDSVTGSTLNLDGMVTVRATSVGAETTLAQITRLVERAQQGKAPVQRLADRISAVFVPAVLGLAALTFVGWMVFGGIDRLSGAVSSAMAVLIIACPCALGLATPTALLAGTGRAAQLGILISGIEVLESTRAVDTIVFDKTGTITTGQMQVGVVTAAPTWTPAQVLRHAAAAERGSEHPIGRAIVAAADVSTLPSATDFRALAGRGVSARVDGRLVVVDRLTPDDIAPWPSPRPIDSMSVAHRLGGAQAPLPSQRSTASTSVAVRVDGELVGTIGLADSVKPSSSAAIAALAQLGLSTHLVSGDRRDIAEEVAADVGIKVVTAEVLPADKVSEISRLQAAGRVVAMVGDGVNDAAALAQADLGIAMGTGSDIAIDASDITITHGDLRSVVDAITLSRRTLRIIRQNLFWAFAYNVAALPIAAFGLLNPMLAGAAMAFSSVFVVLNALRLRTHQGLS